MLKQSLGVVDVDRRVLELVAGGASVQAVLDSLTNSIEKLATACHCTILLLDEDGRRLRKGAGPSLPASYMDIIDGLEIGPEVGACGTAAFLNETIIVEDVATDPKFAVAKDLVMSYGLRSCWSVPIRDSKRKVLGTFAMYHRTPATPRDFELRLVEAAAHLAGNAIERLRTEHRLASIAERLDLAEQAAAFGIWELDINSSAISISLGLANQLAWASIPPHLQVTDLVQMVHADDRPRFEAALERAFETGDLREEVRVVRANGEVRWVRTQARIEIADGAARRAVGALIDITDERTLLDRIQHESERLMLLQRASTRLAAQTGEPQAVLDDTLHTAVQLLDADYGALFQWDADAEHLVRTREFNGPSTSSTITLRSGEGLVGRTFLEQQPTIVNNYSAWDWRLSTAESVFRAALAVPLRHRGSQLGVVLVAKTGDGGHLFDEDDAKLTSLLADQVAAALFVSRTLQQQRYAALHDALTGLANRVLLNDRLDESLRHALHNDEPLALLMMDLDGFKQVNDTCGHAVGDELLHEVSRRVVGAVRTSDVVARLGGDEFAILLPRTDAGGGEHVARAVLDAVREPMQLAGHTLRVGASLGLALYPEHGRTRAELLRCADVAMYAAKAGRRGVATYVSALDDQQPAQPKAAA